MKESRRVTVRTSHAKDNWHGTREYTIITVAGDINSTKNLKRIVELTKNPYHLVYHDNNRVYGSWAAARLDIRSYKQDKDTARELEALASSMEKKLSCV